MPKLIQLSIKNIKTGEVVKKLKPVPERKAERVLRGMLINLNLDKYCVEEKEVTVISGYIIPEED